MMPESSHKPKTRKPKPKPKAMAWQQPEQRFLSILATPDVSKITTAQLYETEYTVIPAIALVEGVLWPNNAPSPELALAEEFGRFPEGWNGRPVMLDHPRIDDIAVSASSPGVLEDTSIGQLFNTRLDGIKLKTEIWISSERVKSLGAIAEDTVERLKSGEAVEVSTGLFSMNEMTGGEFDGEHFDAIWRNIVPDHLAILPEGVKGACSVADGCGAPRVNAQGEPIEFQPVMRAAQLSAAACECQTPVEEEQQGVFQRLLATAGGILGFKSTSQHLSDNDLRMALNSALKANEDESFFFILAVFQDRADKGTLVYELGFDGSLFQRDFSISSSGVIKLGSDRTSVRPVTSFVPVEITTNSTQENTMNKDELIAALIASEGTSYTDEDKTWLAGLDEAHLLKMQPLEVKEEVVSTPTPEATPAPTPAPVAATPTTEEAPLPGEVKPISTDEYIAGAPEEVREILNEGVRLQRQRKNGLIATLRANKQCKFSEDALKAKGIEELENLAILSNDVTFEGNAMVLNEGIREEADEGFTAAPAVFDLSATA